MIDWSTCAVVERDRERVSGAWVFRGTRVPVAALFENLEDEVSVGEFVELFPGVTVEQARAVLEHAARSALAAAQVRVLFDQGTPAPLRKLLPGHEVATAYERGWSTLKNGELLAAAEREGCEVPVTTDSNLKYQQNLASRTIALVVPSTTSWPRIEAAAELVGAAVADASPATYAEVCIPAIAEGKRQDRG